MQPPYNIVCRHTSPDDLGRVQAATYGVEIHLHTSQLLNGLAYGCPHVSDGEAEDESESQGDVTDNKTRSCSLWAVILIWSFADTAGCHVAADDARYAGEKKE